MNFILQTTRKKSLLALILGICLFSTQVAFSQHRTWDGGAGTSTWSDAANWSGDVVPTNTDSVTIIAGANVVVTSSTTILKLRILGSTGSQGKVSINSGVTLAVNSTSATSPTGTNNGAVMLFGGIIDNSGTLSITGKQFLDALRFDNPTSGSDNSTYMGTGTLTCDTQNSTGGGGSPATGASINFSQTSGTATFTVSSTATYNFTLYLFSATGGTKSVFYCPKGNAKINGTGTVSVISNGRRPIRVIAAAADETPNLTIESGVTMNLSTTNTSTAAGMIMVDASASAGASASITNKGTLNFSGDACHSIYMNNLTGATNKTTFTNEGTIDINGTFAHANIAGCINMTGTNATIGNDFTNSGTINYNTTAGGTSAKPLFICGISPLNVVNNSGTITVGTNGTPAIALRLGDPKTTLNNTGTITVGVGSITGGSSGVNAVFNNNTNGILNFNAAATNSLVAFTNAGGAFNVATSQTFGRLTANGGTITVTDGATLTTYYLTLTSGNITLGTTGTGNVVIQTGGSITGGSSGSYVVTNGIGKLTQQGVTSAGALFPIGTASSYDPVTIKPASTLSFGARVGLQSTTLGTNPITNGLVVNREWDITGTTGTTDLTFVSSALNKDGSSTRPSGSVGVVGHYNGTSWDDISSAYASNTWTVTGYIGSFSPFIVASPGAVLPTELLNMTAKAVNNTNVISWETASETNNKGFDVQRQTSNDTWETLGFVQGTGKAATYTFEDKTPLSISYYRLRQVDFDGKETLSKVVSVRQNTKGRIGISPNPTTDKVTIQLNKNGVSDSEATLTLFDVTGRQVLTQKTSTETCQLDLSNLAKGVYMLTVQSNHAVYQEKIIRQ